LEKTYEANFIIQSFLMQYIRSELRFESRALPNIVCKTPDGYFGAITEIEVDKRPDVWQAPRLRTFKRQSYKEFEDSHQPTPA
jgi:hypothetical protein